MRKKPQLGELISVHFTDRKMPIFGMVAGLGDEWILLKHNPVDYQVDGYIVVKLVNVSQIRRGTEEKFSEKILKLKGVHIGKTEVVALTDLGQILGQLNRKFGVFQVEKKSEAVCHIGRLKSIDSKSLRIYTLNSKGKWKGQFQFKLDEIRTIEFETDYINSLKLFAGAK